MKPSGSAAWNATASPTPGFQPSAAAQSTRTFTSSSASVLIVRRIASLGGYGTGGEGFQCAKIGLCQRVCIGATLGRRQAKRDQGLGLLDRGADAVDDRN